MLEINPYYSLKNIGVEQKDAMCKKIGCEDFGFVMKGGNRNTLLHNCSCGHIEVIDEDLFYSGEMACPECGTNYIFDVTDVERDVPLVLKHEVIADCDSVFILALYILSADEVTQDCVSIGMEKFTEFDIFDEASFVVFDREKRELSLYEDICLYDVLSQDDPYGNSSNDLLLRYGEKFKPYDENCCKDLLMAFNRTAIPHSAGFGSYVMVEDLYYLNGFKETVEIMCKNILGEKNAGVILDGSQSGYSIEKVLFVIYIEIYALLKYPLHRNILENGWSKFTVMSSSGFASRNTTEAIDDFYGELAKIGCDITKDTMYEASGLTWTEIFEAKSINLAMKRKKFIKRIMDNDLMEYVRHKEQEAYFWNLSMWILEGIDKIEEASGLGFEDLIKFIIRTIEQKNGKDLLHTLVEKLNAGTMDAGLVKWNRCFDSATLKKYYIINDEAGFMTANQMDCISKRPTMDTFLKVMAR